LKRTDTAALFVRLHNLANFLADARLYLADAIVDAPNDFPHQQAAATLQLDLAVLHGRVQAISELAKTIAKTKGELP
jgi:hypothetical protein